MKKIISFSMWGENPLYHKGAIENAKLVDSIYQGWVARFYCYKDIPKDVINELIRLKAEVIVIEERRGDWEGLFWRFFPADDKNVSLFISRDTDSRLNTREKAAVLEWEESDKSFHSMRDHIEHNVPMLGGMWGAKRGVVHFNMKAKIDEWGQFDHKGTDQEFLSIFLWPEARKNVLAHDRYYNGLISGDYKYNPKELFGDHCCVDFPKGATINIGTYVGEIIK